MSGVVPLNKSLAVFAAVVAYVCWGLLPLFWKAMSNVSAGQILCHRMVWSLVATGLFILLLNKWRGFLRYFKDRKIIARVFFAGGLLAINWLIYIWAVNSGHLIEASLGYYINPLVSVLMGVLILGERLRVGQSIALLFAAFGVGYLTFLYGQFPWIALSLAFTFAIYGLLHKTTNIPVLEGLGLETVPLFLPALGFLLFMEGSGEGAFLHEGSRTTILLMLTGLVTSIPLLLFGYAAKNISLTLLGLLQYIAPTINFLLGIFLYNENFPAERLVGFALVWIALVIYLCEGWLKKYQSKKRVLVEAK